MRQPEEGNDSVPDFDTEGVRKLSAPFPWFGGKRKVAKEVWRRFGRVTNYVEPFFGSGAVLLGRPHPEGTETVNDLDGLVANFWRATSRDPEGVEHWADNPVNENDKHARHIWLVERMESLQRKLEGDPDYYDAKIAGWWVWGVCCHIAGGFCSGRGPWGLNENRQLVRLNGGGHGGITRSIVSLVNPGIGVNRPTIIGEHGERLIDWFGALSERLRYVRVCSGDWSRITSSGVTSGLTGVFLDPPYADTADRTDNVYRKDSNDVAHLVREWAIANGHRASLRIALCGYDGEHVMPPSWSVHEWSAGEGYGAYLKVSEATNNGKRERIWFSPACLNPGDLGLFDVEQVD